LTTAGSSHDRQAGQRLLDRGLRVLVIFELPREIGVVGGHVEVAVPGEQEEDDARLAGLAGR